MDARVRARLAVGRHVPPTVWARSYEPRWLARDGIAALTVWAVIVPQSLAYASLAGVPPETGLQLAIVAAVAYAVLGTCRQLNVGPSSSLAITSAAAVAPLAHGDPSRYLALTAGLALLTGALLVAAGLARLGTGADFFARPVLTGFVFGLAGVITINQAPKLIGVSGGGGNSVEQLVQLLGKLPDANGATVAVGVASLAAMLVLGRIAARLPAALLVVAGATAAVHALDLAQHGVTTLGDVPASLPALAWPGLHVDDVGLLAWPALGLALIAFAESIGAARTVAARHGDAVDPHQELVALGGANVAAGLTGGFSCDASLSRSSVADGSGQRSQLASLGVAALVVLTVLFLTPLFEDLPDAALAAVIVAAVLPLFDVRRIRHLYRADGTDYALAVIAAAAVLVAGILFGILTAVVASLLALVYRGYRPTSAVLGLVQEADGEDADEAHTFRNVRGHPEYRTFPGLLIFRFDSELFFANARRFTEEILHLVEAADPPVRVVIVDASSITRVDTTAADALVELVRRLDERGVDVALARARGTLRRSLARNGVLEVLPERNLFRSLRAAVHAFAGEQSRG